MHCPLCGNDIARKEPAKHLPRFFRCPQCTGFVTDSTEAPVYPETYFTEESSDQKRASIFSPLLNFFLWLRFKKVSRWLPHEGGEILDYGCGSGKLVAYLRSKGLSVEGYDPSPGAVSLAQRRGLPVFRTIPQKQYDLGMFWHSLEHTDTPLADILALKKHLVPTARLLLAVPHGDSIEAHLARTSWFCYDWPFHRVHFTPMALSKLLRKAGFKTLSIEYVNPEYTVSSLAQTFLNLFLPKNVLYSLVSHRRATERKGVLLLTAVASALLLMLCFPLLLVFFLITLLFKKTAAMIVVAEKI